MSLNGFTKSDFDVFIIEGLEARMKGIQSKIQPKFKELGDLLTNDLSMLVGSEMYLHIARHARRKVNPPNDTWLAICHDKRGYKKHPHFQLGLFDDHLFIWLAFIYEAPNKANIAESLITNSNLITELPGDFVISLDHMKKEATSIGEMNESDVITALERLRDVKKAEFLIGRHLQPDSSILKNGQTLLDFTKETYEQLLPIYQKAMAQS
ncbi:YktB family protein [Halalkalibacter lacteus]|uniref:YktB family protein n=1 Tax=Halalkalibacter lacteus TaxID=3090663 RepID=UPI002FC64F19